MHCCISLMVFDNIFFNFSPKGNRKNKLEIRKHNSAGKCFLKILNYFSFRFLSRAFQAGSATGNVIKTRNEDKFALVSCSNFTICVLWALGGSEHPRPGGNQINSAHAKYTANWFFSHNIKSKKIFPMLVTLTSKAQQNYGDLGRGNVWKEESFCFCFFNYVPKVNCVHEKP